MKIKTKKITETRKEKRKGRSIIEKRKFSCSVPFCKDFYWDFAQKKDDIMNYISVTRSYLEIYIYSVILC